MRYSYFAVVLVAVLATNPIPASGKIQESRDDEKSGWTGYFKDKFGGVSDSAGDLKEDRAYWLRILQETSMSVPITPPVPPPTPPPPTPPLLTLPPIPPPTPTPTSFPALSPSSSRGPSGGFFVALSGAPSSEGGKERFDIPGLDGEIILDGEDVVPTLAPSASPEPSGDPSEVPSLEPSAVDIGRIDAVPSLGPSASPGPSGGPSDVPSLEPSNL